MQPNAFEVLKLGGIRLSQSEKQSKRRRNSADQQVSYITCPVCGSSVRESFAAHHVDTCLEKPKQKQAITSQQHAADRQHAGGPRRSLPKAGKPKTGVQSAAQHSSRQLSTKRHGLESQQHQGCTGVVMAAQQQPQQQQQHQQPIKLGQQWQEVPAVHLQAAGRDQQHSNCSLAQKQQLQQQQQQQINHCNSSAPVLAQQHSAGISVNGLRRLPGGAQHWEQQLQVQHQQQAQPHQQPCSVADAAKRPASWRQQRPPQALSNGVQPAAAGQLCHQQRAPTAGVAAVGAPVRNAFAMMAAAAAAQVPLEAHMFLQACSDGSWVCHWWNKGCPCPVSGLEEEWSSSVKANIPNQATGAQVAASSIGSGTGSAKLQLHIATNLPSGYGTPLNWENPLLLSNQPTQRTAQQHNNCEDVIGAHSSTGGVRWRGGGAAVLISGLQKCVRRTLATSATHLGLELLKDAKSAEALLRRLAIICLEDGLLHPNLPAVVWTMMAVGKGYVIGGNLANALLDVTYQMAAIGYRDFLPDADQVAEHPAAEVYQAPPTWQAVDVLLPPSSPEAVLIKAMLIRAAYGGMEGDRSMVLRFTGLWLARFTGRTLSPPVQPTAGQQQQQAVQAYTAPCQQQREKQQQQQLWQQQQHQAHQLHQQQHLQHQQGPVAHRLTAAGNLSNAAPAESGCSTAVSPWLAFLQTAYKALRPPGPGAAAKTTRVTTIQGLIRSDILAAALDSHVTPALTEHLLQQPALQALLQGLASSGLHSPLAARLATQGPTAVVNSTLWQFRSSINHKAWLQLLYNVPQEASSVLCGAPAARQLLDMELAALNAFTEYTREQRQQLLPVWKVIAQLADTWSTEYISKRLY